MVIVNLLEFCCWARCYHGNQKTCWSKTWLYQVYLKIVFIYFWICYFCSADFVSGSNIQYPNVMSAPPFSQAENANIQETGVCFSGKLCERKVPETAFSCEVKRYVVSTRGDRSMPEWLWFNEENRTLVGIPSQKDEGILEILVVGLGHVPNSTQGYICGSSALKVTVRGLMHFPLFAVNPLLRAKPFHGNSNGGNTICGYNEPIVLASFVLPVKFHGLNGKERQTLLKILTSVYDVGIQDAFVLQNTVQNPFLGLLESSHVVASGPGMSGSTATELSTILTWHVKCGVIHVEDPLFEKLKQLSKKLFLTNNISHSVIGWHVITGFQRHYVQHRILRKRRNIIGGTTTPVYSSTIPISRETVVTTRLKPGRTSYITSTVLLTHLQPSPTFSLTFESTSSPGVSSSASIEHFSKRSPSLFSQHLNINSSSELTVTQNESPASQLSFSKLHTSFKSSLSSVLVKRSHTSTLMLPSMTTVSSNGYHRASSEPPLSSAMQLNTTATILSHITSRDTNITTHTLLIPSSHTLPLVTGNLFSSKTALSLQTSSSSFNKINTTPASTSVSSNSTKLLDFSKKSISTTVSNITVISSSPESRTHSTTPTTKEISSITKLTSGDKTTLVITTDQSVYPSSDGSATLDTFITSPSITSTRASSSFLQSYLKTSSLQLHTASSDDGIVSKSSTHEAVSSDRTTVSPQIKTVISFPTQSSTHNFSLASSDQTTTFLFTASQGHETITRQLTNDTSKSVSKSNTYRPSTLQSSKLVRTSSQALVTDKATFSRTISSISGKVSQLQTWIPSLSSTYHDGTTTVDYVSPVSESKKSILMSSVKSLFSPRIATGTMFPVNLTITTFITSAVTSKDRVTSPGSTSSVFARGITPSTTAPLIPTGERSRTTTRSLTSTVLLSSTFNTAVPVSQSLANNSTTTSLISPTEQLTSTFLFLSSERTSTSTSTQTNSVSSSEQLRIWSSSLSSSYSSVQSVIIPSSSRPASSSQSMVVPTSPSRFSSPIHPMVPSSLTSSSSVESMVAPTSSSSVSSVQSTLTPVISIKSVAILSLSTSTSLFETMVVSSLTQYSSVQSMLTSRSPSLTSSVQSMVTPITSPQTNSVQTMVAPSLSTTTGSFQSMTIRTSSVQISSAHSVGYLSMSTPTSSIHFTVIVSSSSPASTIRSKSSSTSSIRSTVIPRLSTPTSVVQLKPSSSGSVQSMVVRSSSSLTNTVQTIVIQSSSNPTTTVQSISSSIQSMALSSSIVPTSSFQSISASTNSVQSMIILISSTSGVRSLSTSMGIRSSSALASPVQSILTSTSSVQSALILSSSTPSAFQFLSTSTSSIQSMVIPDSSSPTTVQSVSPSTSVVRSTSPLRLISSSVSSGHVMVIPTPSFLTSTVWLLSTSSSSVQSVVIPSSSTPSTVQSISTSRSFVQSMVIRASSSPASNVQLVSTSNSSVKSMVIPSPSTLTSSGLAHVTTKYSILPTMTTSSSSMLPSSSIVSSPTTPPNSSPKLYNSFDLLSIQVGKVFNVQIPVDTFHDREDGNTRNLILSCLDGNHNPLSRDSWLQFNSTTQMLYGIILKSQVEQVKTSSEYLLVARDREGNKAYDAFTISVRENDQPLVVKYTLKIVGIGLEKFNQDLNNILLLVKKIAIYYGDEDASFVGVMSVDDGSVLFSWSNTTIRTCNLNLINELSSKIITTDGNIQPAFHNTLLPTFIVEDIHENKTGSCIPSITTEMPKVARLSSHDNTLWLKYFLPGLVVAILILIVAVTCFIVRRHSGVKVLKVDKQTFKRRKPIILDDELEMSTFSGKPVILPDDSLTPIRFPEETPVRITDEEDFPLWFSPVPSAPRYQRPPPSYKRTGDASGYRTPPPPYKLPPSY